MTARHPDREGDTPRLAAASSECTFPGCAAAYNPRIAGRHNVIDGSISSGWCYPPPRYANLGVLDHEHSLSAEAGHR